MGKKTKRVGRTIDRGPNGFINKHITHDGKTWYYVFSALDAEKGEETGNIPAALDRFEQLSAARSVIK